MKQFEEILILLSKHGQNLAYLGTIVVGILATITALINIVFNRINKRDELRYGQLNSARIAEIKNFIPLTAEILWLSSKASSHLSDEDTDMVVLNELKTKIEDNQLLLLKSTSNLIVFVSEKNATIITDISNGVKDVSSDIMSLIEIENKVSIKETLLFIDEFNKIKK